MLPPGLPFWFDACPVDLALAGFTPGRGIFIVRACPKSRQVSRFDTRQSPLDFRESLVYLVNRHFRKGTKAVFKDCLEAGVALALLAAILVSSITTWGLL